MGFETESVSLTVFCFVHNSWYGREYELSSFESM